MIATEVIGTWIDGTPLVRTYSDKSMYIERDGVKYVDAIDPQKFGRVYTETDEPIEEEVEDNE